MIARFLRKIEAFIWIKGLRIRDFSPQMRYATRLRRIMVNVLHFVYTRYYKMDIHPEAKVNFGAKLDLAGAKRIHIGKESYVAPGAVIFTHDYARGLRAHTTIGERCFIGTNAIIMAGITVGDEAVVGSGAVVTRDVPPHSIVAGNPARIIRSGIRTGKYGRIIDPAVQGAPSADI